MSVIWGLLLHRGTLGHFRPAMVLDYQANMGPDDDLYGLCATAWEMLHKGEPLGDALMRQYSGTLCNPAIRVRAAPSKLRSAGPLAPSGWPRGAAETPSLM